MMKIDQGKRISNIYDRWKQSNLIEDTKEVRELYDFFMNLSQFLYLQRDVSVANYYARECERLNDIHINRTGKSISENSI